MNKTELTDKMSELTDLMSQAETMHFLLLHDSRKSFSVKVKNRNPSYYQMVSLANNYIWANLTEFDDFADVDIEEYNLKTSVKIHLTVFTVADREEMLKDYNRISKEIRESFDTWKKRYEELK